MSGTDRPIHSALDDDPAYAEAVDAFVVGLAENIDTLQDAEVSGDLRRVAEQARQLSDAALKAGYGPLQRSADEVVRAATQGSAEQAYKALLVLTDVAKRVRQGHRGSL